MSKQVKKTPSNDDDEILAETKARMQDAIEKRKLLSLDSGIKETPQMKKDRKLIQDLIDDEKHEQMVKDLDEKALMQEPIDNTVLMSKLNWYQVESKLRKIVHDLLQPVIIRSHEDREQIFDTWDYAKKTAARIDEIDTYLFKIEDSDDKRTITEKSSKHVTIAEDSESGSEEPKSLKSESGVKDMRTKEIRKRSTKLDEFDMKIDQVTAELATFKKAQVFIDQNLQKKLDFSDFEIKNIGSKVEIIKQQQSKVDAGFEHQQNFINSNFKKMSEDLLNFRQTMNVEFEKLSDLVKESNFTIKDQEMRQDNFEKQQKKFEQLLSQRKSECDQLAQHFHKIERESVKEAKFDDCFKALEAAAVKLASENVAQQFELNLINNFVDKYYPVRIVHQMSSIFRSVFHNVRYVEELHEKYEEAESLMLDELHQILIMDTGRADLAEVIEHMNFQVATAQKIGLGHEMTDQQKQIYQKLDDNKSKQNKYNGVSQLDRVAKLQKVQNIAKHEVPILTLGTELSSKDSIIDEHDSDSDESESYKRNKTDNFLMKQIKEADNAEQKLSGCKSSATKERKILKSKPSQILMIASKQQQTQKKLNAIRSAVGSSMSSPDKSMIKSDANLNQNEEAALANNIEKLINPNKERLEKLKLDNRFDEIIKQMNDSAKQQEHHLHQTLIDFKVKLQESQNAYLLIMRQENNEMRSYVQQLHNDLDNLDKNVRRRLKNFGKQFDAVDTLVKNTVDHKDQIKCITGILDAMVNLYSNENESKHVFQNKFLQNQDRLKVISPRQDHLVFSGSKEVGSRILGLKEFSIPQLTPRNGLLENTHRSLLNVKTSSTRPDQLRNIRTQHLKKRALDPRMLQSMSNPMINLNIEPQMRKSIMVSTQLQDQQVSTNSFENNNATAKLPPDILSEFKEQDSSLKIENVKLFGMSEATDAMSYSQNIQISSKPSDKQINVGTDTEQKINYELTNFYQNDLRKNAILKSIKSNLDFLKELNSYKNNDEKNKALLEFVQLHESLSANDTPLMTARIGSLDTGTTSIATETIGKMLQTGSLPVIEQAPCESNNMSFKVTENRGNSSNIKRGELNLGQIQEKNSVDSSSTNYRLREIQIQENNILM